MQPEDTNLVEKKPPMTARRSRRRMARDLMPVAHREMVARFECSGIDSDQEIAEIFETQRSSVVSVLLHELYRRVRRIESRQVTNGRIVSIDARKGVAA